MFIKQKNQNNEKKLKWSDIPKQYKSKIDEIDNPVISNIYSKFTFKYYGNNENQNNINDDRELVLFIYNYLVNYKFIIFHLSKSIHENNNSRTNCVFCIEGECLIIEHINISVLENLLSKIKKEQISLINVGKNQNHIFDKYETEAKEEIQNFCEHFRNSIKNNFFVANTIDSIIGYLIRRYYFQTNYFKEPTFFHFDQSFYSIENKIKKNLDDYIFKNININNIENYIDKIRNSENSVPKYKFNEDDFIKLRTLYSKENTFYLVIHIQTLHIFCMKKISNKYLNDESNHEIKFSNYSHRCLVRCYGLLKKDDQTIGLIYEFMCNGSLNMFIRKNDADDFYLLTCIIRILDGIEYFQKNQQIHRDLKPSNILLDHDYLPYISDFETIKLVSTGKSNTNDIGSLSYSSPEQDKGENVSYPTDIYSFGLIIYFLYEKKDMFEIYLEKKGNKTMTKGTEDIKYIYKKCVQFKPEERIKCNEIKSILNNILISFDTFGIYFLNEKNSDKSAQIINFIFEKKIRYLKINESLTFYNDDLINHRFFYNSKCLNDFTKIQGFERDYSKAVEYYEKLAKLNDSYALNKLGQLYEKGKGVKQNYSKSIEYYEKSANLNDSYALLKLGYFHEVGQGVQQDYSKAIKYYEKSANLGNSNALHYLGFIYEKGKGVKQDISKAIKYYEKSANHNSSYAIYRLGFLYDEGKGVKQDISKAIKYYEKSANLDNSFALHNLGILYDEGNKVQQNYIKAIEYYEKSANLENSHSMYRLGVIYKSEHYQNKDYSKAKEYFEKSADLNNSQALNSLGSLYESGLGVELNYIKAFEYYKRSAKLNNSEAFLKIGNFYFNGYGVNINYRKAIQCYEISSNLNNSIAHFILGDIFSNNDIIELNLNKAIMYFQKSIDIQTGLITTSYSDGTSLAKYETNNYRYISYNDIGLIYYIEKNELEEAISNIKESAFGEYPFGQNNFGLLNEFYLKEIGNAKYMYEKSSKHNFSLAEFNLGRLFESNNKSERSIEYFIRASDHEDEALTYRNITRDDKRLKISKKFIICLTNLKLFVYYFMNNNYDESKKYFRRAINNLILNTKVFKYQFKFIFKNQQENERKAKYSNNLFSYLKKFIFNFPPFNLINQPNIDIKSYSDIFEQFETSEKTKESFAIFESKNEFNSNDQSEKCVNNFSVNEKDDNNHEQLYENDEKKNNKSETKKINIEHKETTFTNEKYEKKISETNEKKNTYDIIEITKQQNKICQNIGKSQNEKKIEEFENPDELIDFIISNSKPKPNSISGVNTIFIEEINDIIDIMTKILYTPPYPILFGRISIVKPKEKKKLTQIAIDNSFYEGFEIE